MMNLRLNGILYSLLVSTLGFAQSQNLPTTCISSQFSSAGGSDYTTVNLVLTNNCTKPVDLQGAIITFKSSSKLDTNFWGTFDPLSYPEDPNITSQTQTDGSYLETIVFKPQQYAGSNSILDVKKSITISYGTAGDGHKDGSVQVYLQSPSTVTGTLSIKNNSAQPANIGQAYALVHVKLNGQAIQDLQVPWGGKNTLTLNTGTYSLVPESVTDSSGHGYQGTASPASVLISEKQTANSVLSYQAVSAPGSIVINLQKLPDELVGYTTPPTVVITKSSSSTTSVQIPWGTATTVSSLDNGEVYSLSSQVLNYAGVQCSANFDPTILTAVDKSPPSSKMTYKCISQAQIPVSLSVSGLPTTVNSLNVMFKPSDGSSSTSQTVTVSGGSGSGTVNLIQAGVYTVSTDNVSGYTPSFSKQPFSATPGASLTIEFSKGGGCVLSR